MDVDCFPADVTQDAIPDVTQDAMQDAILDAVNHAVAGFCHAACCPADFSRDHATGDAIWVVASQHPVQHQAVAAKMRQTADAAKDSTFADASVGCFPDSEAGVVNRADAKTLRLADVKQHQHQVAGAKQLRPLDAENRLVTVAAKSVCWIGSEAEGAIVATKVAAPHIPTLDVATAAVVRSCRIWHDRS